MSSTESAAVAQMLTTLDAPTFSAAYAATFPGGSLRDSEGRLRELSDGEREMQRLVRAESRRRGGQR